jgi:hypothetical protein
MNCFDSQQQGGKIHGTLDAQNQTKEHILVFNQFVTSGYKMN